MIISRGPTVVFLKIVDINSVSLQLFKQNATQRNRKVVFEIQNTAAQFEGSSETHCSRIWIHKSLSSFAQTQIVPILRRKWQHCYIENFSHENVLFCAVWLPQFFKFQHFGTEKTLRFPFNLQMQVTIDSVQVSPECLTVAHFSYTATKKKQRQDGGLGLSRREMSNYFSWKKSI